MIFRVVNEGRMQQVRDLWTYSFEKPGTAFYDYYFQEYCGKNNMVVGGFEEVNKWERLRTMVHINPYRLRLRGQELLVPYLVGVATAPEARGRHCLEELLDTTFEILRAQECSFVTLMPIYAGIYLPYGFAYTYYRHKYEGSITMFKTLPTSSSLRMEREPLTKELLTPLYARLTEKYNGLPIRTDFQWQKLLAVHSGEGVQAVVAYNEEGPVGYMLYTLNEGTLTIIELLASEVIVRNSLLKYASGHESEAKRLLWLAPAEDKAYMQLADQANSGSVQPFMMARCIDARRALALLAKPLPEQGQLILLLTDEQIPRNNHLLSLSWDNGPLKVKSTVDQEDFKIPMAAFTQLFFGTFSGQELLEEGLLSSSLTGEQLQEKLALLDQLLPKALTFNNEYF